MKEAAHKENKRVRQQPINSVEMVMDAIPQNESFARLALSAFLAPLNPTIEELSDLKTAISEAVTNAIVHGYRGRTGKIYISLKAYADRSISLRIRDKGVGIEDIEQAMEPLFTTDPDGERGGLGFTVMQSFTDRLSVLSKPGRGTTVTMHKSLAARMGS